ncbi:MAG TPA: copper chaperone [Anaerolineales bacterium]|nr:copper chaperone [Anaerolineae bacterium]HIP86809.1 copper chaperone [Anaerolineales bacterium]
MKKIVLDVPLLWADHHVLKVRDVLGGLDGVEDMYVSSAWKKVLVTYDPGKIAPDAIEKALAEAGYPVGEGETPILAQRDEKARDPKWEVLGFRMSETYQADVEMSGDFRKW